MCNPCQMSQIYILDEVNIYLISIVYKTWPDLLHHFLGQPLSTSSLLGSLSLVLMTAGTVWPFTGTNLSYSSDLGGEALITSFGTTVSFCPFYFH